MPRPHRHTTYEPEEKTQIVMGIFAKKFSIRKIAADKSIKATLISLWKKQAETAIADRFQPHARGRRKTRAIEKQQQKMKEIQEIRRTIGKANAKSRKLEAELQQARERVALLEGCIHRLSLDSMASRLVKLRRDSRIKLKKP